MATSDRPVVPPPREPRPRPAATADGPDPRVYDLARDLFAQKVIVGACQSRVVGVVIDECFTEAAAFVAAAAQRGY